MPSCKRFFEELGNCLVKSECCVKYGNKPTECLELLMKSKVQVQSQKEKEASEGRNANDSSISPISTTEVPTECFKAHQSYSECRIALMNPKSRFRGPYGG